MNADSHRGLTALIVEDHDAVRRALCDRVQASFGQFQCREAGTVDEAIRIVESEQVDLVLMDFRLPGVDGVEGTRRILQRAPHTPVVMVSVFDDPSHRSAARNAGVRAYVPKRAIGKELIPAIESVVACGR